MTKNKKGFTIIEVVLVLAIAGLIFLMVFIALPALQRSQRNTRRRSDMARILSAVTSYQSNNGGKSPALPDLTWGEGNAPAKNADADFVPRYVDDTCTIASGKGTSIVTYTCTGDQFKDPDGSEYSIEFTSGVAASYWSSNFKSGSELFQNHRILLGVGLKCSGNESAPLETIKGLPSNQVAIIYALEGGAIYCGDNQ